jgi:hypothetical protein
MILGMDIWVFTAWIGTIIVALLSIIYGIYDWLSTNHNEKKSKEKSSSNRKKYKKR